MDLKLRPAYPEDADLAYQIKKLAFRDYVDQAFGWDEIEERNRHETRYASQEFRIIQLSGLDIGILAIQRDAKRYKLNQLFIRPEHQGKTLGSACMQIVIEEASSLNLPIQLRVLRVNPRAIAFYERLGFTEVGHTDTHIQMQRDP